MSDRVTLKLTNRQANLLLQSLLFSCTSDITADWDSDDLRDMVGVSKVIEKEIDDIDLEKIQAYAYRTKKGEAPVFEDEWTKDILEHFKRNIKVVDVTSQVSIID